MSKEDRDARKEWERVAAMANQHGYTNYVNLHRPKHNARADVITKHTNSLKNILKAFGLVATIVFMIWRF